MSVALCPCAPLRPTRGVSCVSARGAVLELPREVPSVEAGVSAAGLPTVSVKAASLSSSTAGPAALTSNAIARATNKTLGQVRASRALLRAVRSPAALRVAAAVSAQHAAPPASPPTEQHQ